MRSVANCFAICARKRDKDADLELYDIFMKVAPEAATAASDDAAAGEG